MKKALKKVGKFLLGAGRAICAGFALIIIVPFLFLIDEDDRYYGFED